MTEPMLDYVRRKLADSAGHRAEISEETGVPYFTLAKIAQGVTANPRTDTVQRLHDYFRKHETKLKRLS